MTGPEHYREAEEAIKASTFAYQKWGEGIVPLDRTDADLLEASLWEIRRAQVHALLALAAATALPRAVAGDMMEDDCESWLAVVEARRVASP